MNHRIALEVVPALVRLCLRQRSFLTYFLIIFYIYSSSFNPYCSHARSILRGCTPRAKD